MHKIKSGDLAAIRPFSRFSSAQEYKQYIDKFIYHYKHRLSPTAYLIVKTIKHMTDFAVGVFTWTKKWMAEKIQRSPRMVSYAIRQLRDIGFLTDAGEQTYHEGDRRLGHNVWIVQRIPLPEAQNTKSKDCSPHCTPEIASLKIVETPLVSQAQSVSYPEQCPINNSPSKERNSYTVSKRETVSLGIDILNHYVPSVFAEAAIGFYEEEINELWDTVIYTYCKVLNKKWDKLSETEYDTAVEFSLQALQTILKKRRKLDSLRIPYGSYMHGIIKRMTRKHLKEINTLFDPLFKVLEDTQCKQIKTTSQRIAPAHELDKMGVF